MSTDEKPVEQEPEDQFADANIHKKAKAMAREDAKKKSEWAYSIVKHVDNHGRVVEERKVVFGTPPRDCGFTRFISKGMLRGKLKIGAPVSKMYDIPLPHATTVEEAFAQIHEYIEEAYDQAVKDLNQEVADEMRKQHERMAEEARSIKTITGAAVDSKGRIVGGPGSILGG